MFDPRLLTGPAFILLGLCFLLIAARLWLVHPINRVFRLGPFVTERGMTAVLNLRPVFLAYGLLGLVSGSYRSVFWFAKPDVNAPIILVLGSMEMVFASWSAAMTVWSATKLWRSE